MQARKFSAPAETKVIFKEHSPAVHEWILDKQKVLNSIDTEMCQTMCDRLVHYHKNATTAPRLFFLSGAGEKSFCAGGDIVSIYKMK